MIFSNISIYVPLELQGGGSSPVLLSFDLCLAGLSVDVIAESTVTVIPSTAVFSLYLL